MHVSCFFVVISALLAGESRCVPIIPNLNANQLAGGVTNAAPIPNSNVNGLLGGVTNAVPASNSDPSQLLGGVTQAVPVPTSNTHELLSGATNTAGVAPVIPSTNPHELLSGVTNTAGVSPGVNAADALPTGGISSPGAASGLVGNTLSTLGHTLSGVLRKREPMVPSHMNVPQGLAVVDSTIPQTVSSVLGTASSQPGGILDNGIASGSPLRAAAPQSLAEGLLGGL